MVWPVNARTSLMMDAAQAIYGATITATKGSPVPPGGPSAFTHSGQGVIDVVGANLDAIVAAMRQVGFAAWHRTPAQGFPHHIHGVAVGEPLLHPTAALQVQSYFAGRNGLANDGPDDGPRTWVGVTWETYTGGTYVPPVTTPTPIPGRMWNQYPGDRSGSLLDSPAGVLAGSPTLDPPGGLTFYAADLHTPVASLTLTAGDSVMLAALEDFDYGVPVDVTQGYWLLRYTGGGTLTVADSYDLGYNYPAVTPTWTARAKVGDDTEGLAYYAFDPTMLDASHLYNDGWPLIRITCTAGTVVLDFIGLQVQTGAGYWIPDGEEEWSAGTAPTDRLLPYDPLDPTFYSDAGTSVTTRTWTVDGTPVYMFQPLTPEMDEGYDVNTFGRKVGNEVSFTSAEDAVAQRDANITDTTGGLLGYAAWELSYDDGIGIFPIPENWRSTLNETPQFWTTPGKTELPFPPGLPALGWRRTTTYEFLDDDTGLLSWVVGPALGTVDDIDYCVTISGDAQTVTLYLNTFSEFVVASTFDHHAGTVVGSFEKDTDDDLNVGGPYPGVQGTFAETEITTTDTLLILSLDSTIREATDLRHTYPGGGGHIEGYTGSVVGLTNIPVLPKYRVPGYRYEQPSFVQAPTFIPTITDLEDPVLETWLRQRQRDDGLGSTVARGHRGSSKQRSLRQRGYR